MGDGEKIEEKITRIQKLLKDNPLWIHDGAFETGLIQEALRGYKLECSEYIALCANIMPAMIAKLEQLREHDQEAVRLLKSGIEGVETIPNQRENYWVKHAKQFLGGSR
jgi:hypothetical protein